MTLEAKQVWICGVCETVHDDEYSAEECCPPEIWEMWQCPVCGENHDLEEEALECCQDVEDEEEALSTGGHRIYPKDLRLNAHRYIEQFILMNKYVD